MEVKSLLTPEEKNILNDAIAQELHASNMYKHIANQMQRLGFFGANKYFLQESSDELTHYQKIVDFINDMGDVADVPAVSAITDKVENLEDALTVAIDAELFLGKKYQEWYGKVGVMTQQFLLQFIEIQRVSIGEYGDLISRYNVLKGDTCGFIIFDQELGGE